MYYSDLIGELQKAVMQHDPPPCPKLRQRWMRVLSAVKPTACSPHHECNSRHSSMDMF
jgi:hypothetical protein